MTRASSPGPVAVPLRKPAAAAPGTPSPAPAPETTARPKISLSAPFPLLDAGRYVARCTGADYAWANQWKKWIAKLELDPLDYTGARFVGKLCKFLQLGSNPNHPHAGPQSEFRRLLVECNGDQPTSLDVGDTSIFAGRLFDIDVEVVKHDRKGKPRLPVHWYSVVRTIHVHSAQANTSTLQQSNPLTLQH